MQRRVGGFTLIELVTVMVVLAIVAVMGVGFVVSSTVSYRDSQERTRLVNRSRQAIERITRQLRGAAPHSLRITNGGNCIEFLPLAGGGNYLAQVPDSSNGAAADNSIVTGPFQVSFATPDYLLIGARSAADIYGGGSLASVASAVSGAVTLTVAKVWQRNSPQQRFFLAGSPQAFCLAAGDLRFYSGYATPLTTTGIPSGVGVLISESVSATTPFALDTGTEVRGTVVLLDLLFSEGNQQVAMQHKVFVRNVP